MFNISNYLTTILLILTAWYAYSTFKLVKENEKIRKELKTPYIILDLDLHHSLFYLIIKNLGGGPAKDIKFEIEPDILYYKEENIKLSELPILNNLQYMPPNKEIKFIFGSAHYEIGGEKFYKYKFNISIEYYDIFNKKHKNKYQMDLSKYEYLLISEEYDLRDIYKKIEEFEKDFRDIKNYFEKLLVYGINIIQPINYEEIVDSDKDFNVILKKNLLVTRAILDTILDIIRLYSIDKTRIFTPYSGSFELHNLIEKIALKLRYISKSLDTNLSSRVEDLSRKLFEFSFSPIVDSYNVNNLIINIDEIIKNL